MEFKEKQDKLRRIKRIFFMVTEECNFNCSFCYQKNTRVLKKNKQTMSPQVAFDAMDFFLCKYDLDACDLIIYFWGGEPLLNFDLIKKFTDKYPQIKSCFTTNGSPIDSTMRNYLIEKRNQLRAQLSLSSAYEKYGSLQKAVNELHYACDVIRECVFPVNFLALKLDTLYEDFKFLYNNGLKNIMIDLPTHVDVFTKEHIELFVSQICKILDEYPATIDPSVNSGGRFFMLETELWKKELNYKKQLKQARFCGSGINEICIAPNGDIWRCEGSYELGINKMGSIYSDIDFNALDEVEPFYAKPENYMNKYCTNCELYLSCPRVKCLALNHEITNDILRPPISWCQANKAFNEISKRYIDKNRDRIKKALNM